MSHLDRLKELAEKENAPVVAVCAAMESEIAELEDDEKAEFLFRNATSEIKEEINKSVEKSGIDTSLIDEVKQEVEKAKEGLEDPLGSIKRNR